MAGGGGRHQPSRRHTRGARLRPPLHRVTEPCCRIDALSARTVSAMRITYAERAELQPAELRDLFARAWAGAAKRSYHEVLARSFSWISAHDEDRLVGFVNVAWDGGVHF